MEDFIRKENDCSISCNFSSTLDNIDRTIDAVKNFLHDRRIPARPFDLFFVLRESLNNAVIHGNDKDSNLRVYFTLHAGADEIVMTITDEGKGFNWRQQIMKTSAPCGKTSGRGLDSIRRYGFSMDFNEAGNTLYLTKKIL